MSFVHVGTLLGESEELIDGKFERLFTVMKMASRPHGEQWMAKVTSVNTMLA